MAGYHNFSMSNNAVSAYQSGEMPLSKWTKTAILEEVQEQTDDEKLIAALRKSTLASLKKRLLVRTSWHHTSCKYNRTDFYSVELDEDLTPEKVLLWNNEKEEQKQEKAQEKRVRARFLEWVGSSWKRAKPVEYEKDGTIRGAWFFPDDGGKKKKVDGNGFKVLQVL